MPTKRALQGGVLYRGWTMAAVGFVSVALVFGASVATLPFIYGAVVDEFGWSVTEAALLFTYKNVASAIAALFLLGPLLERLGLRLLMVGSFVATGIGLVAFLAVESLPMYYLAGIALGCGNAAAMVGTNIFVSRWFYRNQGLAIGLALAGTSVGGVVFPPLSVALIETVGWRAALASLSLSIWLVALPIYLWKAQEDPTEEDLAPELGVPPVVGAGESRAPAAVRPVASPAAPDRKVMPILRTTKFWRIAFALFFVAAADAAVLQHTPLLLTTAAGMSAGIVASSLSVMFAFGVVGKIAAGRLFDACSIKGMSLWNILLAASIALALPVAGVVTLLAFASVRGVAHGGLVPKPAVLAKHCYGPSLVGVVLPVLMGVWLLGAGLGPAMLAMVFDATGHYRYGILSLVALSCVAAALIRGARPDHRDAPA